MLIEEDDRFAPFDASNWKSFAADTPQDKASICAAIEAALPNAIVYRRRDYEAEAMMRELLRRNGLILPMGRVGGAASCQANHAPTTVAVLCHRGGAGGDMCDELVGALNRAPSGLLAVSEDAQAVDSADKVLLLLSEGVLRGDSLARLRLALAKDRASQIDRLVLVCRTKMEGWNFDKKENAEIREAPDEVQAALENHEAITYRAPSQGASRHEFSIMVDNLMRRLVPEGTRKTTNPVAPVVAPIQTVRQQFEGVQHELQRAASALAAEKERAATEKERAETEIKELRDALHAATN